MVVGAIGALPGVGAVSNFALGFGAGWDSNSAAGTYAGLGAAGLNAVGTVALIGGGLFGSSTTIKAAVGILGVSGLAAGITAAAVDF